MAQDEKRSAMKKYVGDLRDYWTYYYSLRELTLYDFIAGKDLDVDFDALVQ